KMVLKEPADSDFAKRLAKQYEKALLITDKDYGEVFSEEQRSQWDALQADVAAVERTKPASPPQALAIRDTKPQPEPTWLLERGDFYAKQSEAPLGFLSVLTSSKLPDEYWAAARNKTPSDQSTAQRRAVADWMTDTEQGAGALLARVIV